jgi:hypothetical protein
MTETSKMSRRHMVRLITIGGATSALAACQMNTDMISAGLGGAGTEANWLELGKEFEGGLSLIAGQTDRLLIIQADYAGVLDLKDLEAKLRTEASNMSKGDTFGASSLRTADKLSKDAERAIVREVNKAENLSARQQQVLAQGQSSHEDAIQKMWVGVIRISKVLFDARSAKKPSFQDIELVNVAKNITATGPRAMSFGKTSKATYEAYNEAFQYKGVYVPPRNRVSELSLPSV